MNNELNGIKLDVRNQVSKYITKIGIVRDCSRIRPREGRISS
jgi:hypothetical protein